jgi:hypothetical protein
LPPGGRVRFDLTSKKIPLTASQNLIAKLFGQQHDKRCPHFSDQRQWLFFLNPKNLDRE